MFPLTRSHSLSLSLKYGEEKIELTTAHHASQLTIRESPSSIVYLHTITKRTLLGRPRVMKMQLKRRHHFTIITNMHGNCHKGLD